MTIAISSQRRPGGTGNAPGALVRLVVFSVSGESYAIYAEDVEEITPLAELAHPPNAPSILAGLLNLGGQTVPVVHLARMFGAPRDVPGLYTPLLILRNGTRKLALQVERVNRIVSVSESQVLPVPHGHSFNDCACGVVRLEDQTVLLLAAEQLLLDKERKSLNDLEALESARLGELRETAS